MLIPFFIIVASFFYTLSNFTIMVLVRIEMENTFDEMAEEHGGVTLNQEMCQAKVSWKICTAIRNFYLFNRKKY